jgi:hypothetical protein
MGTLAGDVSAQVFGDIASLLPPLESVNHEGYHLASSCFAQCGLIPECEDGNKHTNNS